MKNVVSILLATKPTYGDDYAGPWESVSSFLTDSEGEGAAEEAFTFTNAPFEFLNERSQNLQKDYALLRKRSVSVGDKIRVTRNGSKADGREFLCTGIGWKEL
jgi:hypothetical protein